MTGQPAWTHHHHWELQVVSHSLPLRGAGRLGRHKERLGGFAAFPAQGEVRETFSSEIYSSTNLQIAFFIYVCMCDSFTDKPPNCSSPEIIWGRGGVAFKLDLMVLVAEVRIRLRPHVLPRELGGGGLISHVAQNLHINLPQL